MSKPVTVYKVVIREGDGILVSSGARFNLPETQRKYKSTRYTLPIPGTPLLAFATLQAAKRFNVCGYEELWEAKAIDVVFAQGKSSLLPHDRCIPSDTKCFGSVKHLQNFWKSWRRQPYWSRLWDDIVLCKKIKLVKQINPYE